MIWDISTQLKGGKHSGKTFLEVIDTDIHYLERMVSNLPSFIVSRTFVKDCLKLRPNIRPDREVVSELFRRIKAREEEIEYWAERSWDEAYDAENDSIKKFYQSYNNSGGEWSDLSD